MPSTFSPSSQIAQLINTHFDHSDEPVIITDGNVASQKIVYVNQAYTHMSGWALEEVVGKKATFMQGAKTNRKVIERLKQAITQQEDFRGSTINYRKNGDEYYVEWNIHCFEDAITGERYFISVQHDLSELKQALDRLKQSTPEFRQHLSNLMASDDPRARAELHAIFDQSGTIAEERHRRAKINSIAELLQVNEAADALFIDASQTATSAEDYLNDYYIDPDSIHGIQELLTEIDAAIHINKHQHEQLESELALLFGDLATNIFSLEGFVEVSSALTELAAAFMNGSDIDEQIMSILDSLVSDLMAWNDTVFINQNSTDIHALDQSIIGSANQIVLFLKQGDDALSSDNDVELF